MISLVAGALLQTSVASMSLQQAFDYSRVHRGTVAAAATMTREAQGFRRIAGHIPNPALSYSYSQDPPRQHVSVEQPLSWLMTRGPERVASDAGIRRAALDSTGFMAGTFRDVRGAYFSGIGAEQTWGIASELQAAADSLRRIAQARFDAGDIARLELEQVEQDARRQGQTLSEAREARDQARAAFGQAIGWEEPGPAPLPAGALDLMLDDAEYEPNELPIIVRSAEADSAVAHAERVVAQRAAVPFPGLQIGADWDDPGAPGRTLSVIGISVPLPFWHRNDGERAVAGARADRATAALAEARALAARQVAETRSRLRETAGRARFARDSLLPAARTLRGRAVAAYRVGETGVIPVLEALRAEREIALGAVQDLIRFQQARAAWLELFGRQQ